MLDVGALQTYVNRADNLRDALVIPPAAPLQLTPIGQGEYNANFAFEHPTTGHRMVLRLNFGSQMHLDNQIEYEYESLKLLQNSGRTPIAYFVDDSRRYLDCGILVMSYCPGRHLIYERDLNEAAAILADVHSVPLPQKCHLLRPHNPLQAIVDECTQMFAFYREASCADTRVVQTVDALFTRAREFAHANPPTTSARHCISTELNSTNFLIGEKGEPGHLVDWEKPLAGEVEQDLAHFLAPTTTFWKTDTVLSRAQMEGFLATYEKAVAGRFAMYGLRDRFECYLPITCLRGITWCAMAYVEYLAPDRVLKNESTFKKIQEYLSSDFLSLVEHEYFN